MRVSGLAAILGKWDRPARRGGTQSLYRPDESQQYVPKGRNTYRTYFQNCLYDTYFSKIFKSTGLINYQNFKKLQIFKIWNSVYTSKSMSPHYNFHPGVIVYRACPRDCIHEGHLCRRPARAKWRGASLMELRQGSRGGAPGKFLSE